MNTMRIPFAIASCALLAVAWLGPMSAQAGDRAHRSQMPVVGIPYASVTTTGDLFLGAVRVDRFEVDEDRLKAVGLLLKGRRAQETEFPVEVVRSSCDVLELKVGPPEEAIGRSTLETPLVLLESVAGSELRQSDFCGLAAAYAADDLLLLVDRLNETAKIAAGVIGSCPWWKQIECAFAITSCRSICTLYTPFNPLCIKCFEDLNAGSCISCYIN